MKYIRKQFLSDDYDETGSIVVKVLSTEVEHMSDWQVENRAVTASVEFRDCHGKPIYLEFSIDKEHSLQDRHAKIDKIIDELRAMKMALAKALVDTDVAIIQYKAKMAAEEAEALKD